MAEISPEELLEEIRDGLSAPAWSSAVLAVRKGNVSLFRRDGDLYTFDVIADRRLPYRVELNLDDEDWSCTCAGVADSCTHVAAAAIALKRGVKKAESTPPQSKSAPSQEGHLRFDFYPSPQGWVLKLYCVREGKAPERVQSFAGLAIPTNAGEKEVLSFSGWQKEGDYMALRRVEAYRFSHLLNALALCRDICVEGKSVGVQQNAMRRILVVQDHPEGILVREGVAGGAHRILEGPLPLVVVGDPPILAPLAPSPLKSEAQDYYRRGRIYAHARIPYFMGSELPRLKEKIGVELKTQGAKPIHMPAYALLRLTPAAGGLDAVGSVAYGKPPRAVVVDGRLHLLKKGAGVPIRMAKRERELAQAIEAAIGMPVGRKLRLRGEEAARFVADTLPRFPGQVSGAKTASRFRKNGVLRAQFTGDAQQLDMHFTLPVEGGETLKASAAEVYAAWREGRAYANLLDGGLAQIPRDWMAQYGMLLEQMMEAREGQPTILQKVALAQLAEAADMPPNLAQLGQSLRSVLEPLEIETPSQVNATLRPYQSEGLNWLNHLESQGIGGILADDMGLGKTLQSLSLIAHDPGPTLVVAPTSVVYNWAQEAAKFIPHIPVMVYQGPKRKRLELEAGQLVLTSYAILRLDIERLKRRAWHRVFLDEAQAIKNPDSQVSRAARQLQAKHRFALTGTPVENHLRELWSLLDFVNPGLLGGRRNFESRYADLSLGDERGVKALRVRVKPFVKRRLKKEVATDLPPKTEVVLRCELSAAERKVYEAVRLAGFRKVQKLLGDGGKERKPLEVLEILLRLRQAACHPLLVPGTEFEGSASSSKVDLLLNQLDVILKEGHKALVFSQWTGFLDLVEVQLRQAGIDWLRLDGSTRNRQGVVDRFQSEDGPGVFLISLKAGGTGLNLTAADYVYLMDPWWNPAVEAQAIDRTYRIGQENPVVATRLVAADTVEEKILALQDQKRDLAEAAIGGGEARWVGSLSEGELRDLLEI